MSTISEHYQEKFVTKEEATADAKKMSKKLEKQLHVIQSKSIFYVDEAAPKHKHEILIASFDSGRKVELPKEEVKKPVAVAPVAETKPVKHEVLRLSKGDGVKTDIEVDLKHLLMAAKALRAMNHKLRKQMILLIEEQPAISVTEIYVKLRLEQSVASQHLAILRQAGIVRTKRDGKQIHYYLNKKRIADIVQLLPQLAQQQ